MTRVNNPDQVAPLSAPTEKVAAFFDLDKTIIAMSSVYAYGKEFLTKGLISPVVALQLSFSQASYKFAGHNSTQMDNAREQLTAMIAGWEVDQIQSIAEDTVQSVVTPTIYAEARELIKKHQSQGHDVIIVSASIKELVDPIARELNVEQTITTLLETVDGRYTGEVLFFSKGESKAAEILKLAAEKGYALASSFAYSDSATDVPMLEAVGFPHAVNPDRILRKTALERDWPILSFKNPEPLFQLPSPTEIRIGTGVVIGIALVTMLGLHGIKRRKRRKA